MKPGDRVEVVQAFPEEPELLGMQGDVVRVGTHDVGVFLDGDKYPTMFLSEEVALVS